MLSAAAGSRQTDGQTDKMDRWMDIQADRYTGRQAGRQTGRQTDRQADGLTDKMLQGSTPAAGQVEAATGTHAQNSLHATY